MMVRSVPITRYTAFIGQGDSRDEEVTNGV